MRQQVNLLTPELLPKPERLSLQQLLGIWCLFCAALLIGSAFNGWRLWSLERGVADLQGQWRELEQHNNELEAELIREPEAVLAAQVADLTRRAQQRQQLLELLDADAPRGTTSFSGVLGDLARYPVPGLWFDGIRLEHAGQTLALEGRAMNPARLPELLKALKRTRHIAGRRFDRLQLEQDPEGGVRFLLATAEELGQ